MFEQIKKEGFEPKEIYSKVIEEINYLVEEISELNLPDAKMDEEQKSIKEKLNSQKQELEKSIDELSKLSEWDKFTIAFYGETNAGKSTLVETLRILFNESTKLAERKEYRKILNIIEDLEQEITQNNDEIQKIEKKYSTKIKELEVQIDELNFSKEKNEEKLKEKQKLSNELYEEIEYTKDKIILKKKESLRNFILWLFKKLDEQKEIGNIKKEITNNEREQKEIEIEIKNDERKLENVKKEEENQKKNKSDELQKLIEINRETKEKIEGLNVKIENYCDGKIIGDGRSDFTQKTNKYILEFGNEKFRLLDLPGIEGKEEKVIDEINKSLKSSHAIFYISSEAKPPQTSNNNGEGTLEKIKKQLGNQTEIYFIYNKRVNNPRQLKKENFINEGEEESLKETEKILKSKLGNQYKENMTLSAYPAFIACANVSPKKREQKDRFFNLFETKEKILEYSLINNLKKWIVTNINKDDISDRIKKANYQKVITIVEKTSNKIEEQNKILEGLKKDIEENRSYIRERIKKVGELYKKSFDNELEESLRKFKTQFQNKIYEIIDEDINNEEFKNRFESEMKIQENILSDNLKNKFVNISKKFQEDVEESIKKYNKLKRELLDEYSENFDSLEFEININLKIEEKSVIPLIVSTVGGIGGIILTMTTGGLALVLSVLGALIAIGKSIYSFFDHDYRKAEQRKSATRSIEEIVKEVRENIKSKNLNSIYDKIDLGISSINKKLESDTSMLERIIRTCNQTKDRFNSMIKFIENSL